MHNIVTVSILSVAALLIAGALAFAPQTAQAGPAFTSQTGKACPTCHTAPPALNATGKKFKANGNKF